MKDCKNCKFMIADICNLGKRNNPLNECENCKLLFYALLNEALAKASNEKMNKLYNDAFTIFKRIKKLI